MRLVIFLIATFSFPSIAKAECQNNDIVGAVIDVETGTTVPVMITPLSEISTYELFRGFKILANSEIVTDSTSRVSLIFLDGTSLKIGPNARVKIDKYVYACDPSKVTEQTLKGFLRLISGTVNPVRQVPLGGFSGISGTRG